ncbi:MAG: tetratricopeptide repeat protein [Bacteroidota bacterium]
MAKKLTRKEKIALQKQQQETDEVPVQKHVKRPPKQSRTASALKRTLGLIVALVAFLLYANTLTHQYALDDYGVIPENTITRKGFDGVGEIFKTSYRSGRFTLDYSLYRPLSKAMFAAEWGLAPNTPELSHFVNVVLFALTGFLLFYALSLYMQGRLLIPFLASVLFVAHPIHTEAVANIKGRDEILCFLFFIITAIFIYRYLTANRALYLVLAAAAFFLSFLSKESAITFLAVIPLMLYFFTDIPVGRYALPMVLLVAVSGIFLLIRYRVLELDKYDEGPVAMIDNYMATMKDFGMQKATAVFIMGVYLKLLFFPHPLICDGSFNHFPAVGFSDWRFLVPFVIYAALAVYAVLRFKKKDVVAFGIIYFFVTASIASNIPMIIGTNYGERLMYAPSLGFCIAIAALLARLREEELPAPVRTAGEFMKQYFKPIGVLSVITLLFGFQTFSRNLAWYDNRTLYSEDLKTAPNSARLHYYLGNQLSIDDYIARLGNDSVRKNQAYDSAMTELYAARSIYPQYADAIQKIGQIHLARNKFDSAIYYYDMVMKLFPTNATYQNNYGNLMFKVGRLNEAKTAFENAIRFSPAYAHPYNNLASVYGEMGASLVQQAQQEPSRSNELIPQARQNFETSVSYSLKAIQLDPDYYQAYQTVAITYGFLGDKQKQQEYMSLFEQAKKRAGF